MDKNSRANLAKISLTGISIGDAFGESFFGETQQILIYIQNREIPKTTWQFTDDTIMSIAIFEQLKKNGDILQEELIRAFVRNHQLDPMRGYGATARRILREIEEGGEWKRISATAFDGMGSMGNGAAMRVTPIGAYFHDDLYKVTRLAMLSAQVTHTHVEGIAGAVAIALATALATQHRLRKNTYDPHEFISTILEYLPEGETASRIRRSLNFPKHTHLETLKKLLGNGSQIMAQDTVPFCIWCAAYHLDNFEEALWKAVSVLGDRDTICAMVGGIVVMSCDKGTVPVVWQDSVEKIEGSLFLR